MISGRGIPDSRSGAMLLERKILRFGAGQLTTPPRFTGSPHDYTFHLSPRRDLLEVRRRALGESLIRALDEQGGEIQLRRQREALVAAEHHQRGGERVGADRERVDDRDGCQPVRQRTAGPRIENVRDPLAVDFAILPVVPRGGDRQIRDGTRRWMASPCG